VARLAYLLSLTGRFAFNTTIASFAPTAVLDGATHNEVGLSGWIERRARGGVAGGQAAVHREIKLSALAGFAVASDVPSVQLH